MPPTPGPGPQQELDWCVFVCVAISLIDKSTYFQASFKTTVT